MKNFTKWKTVLCAVNLAEALPIDEMPTAFRSDEWWTEFWRVMGVKEAKRIKEAV